MNGLHIEVEHEIKTTTKRTLTLTSDQVEIILRNWAMKNQGFGDGTYVELTESQGMCDGAYISHTTVEIGEQ